MNAKLSAILADMLTEAHANRGRRIRRTLPGDLALVVYICELRRIHLAMIRRGIVGPSLTEWNTVMRAIPWPLPPTWPQPGRVEVTRPAGRLVALVADWPLTPDIRGA